MFTNHIADLIIHTTTQRNINTEIINIDIQLQYAVYFLIILNQNFKNLCIKSIYPALTSYQLPAAVGTDIRINRWISGQVKALCHLTVASIPVILYQYNGVKACS